MIIKSLKCYPTYVQSEVSLVMSTGPKALTAYRVAALRVLLS